MQGNELLLNAIEASNESGRFFYKFISANDVGANGSHQDGIYLNKESWHMFFDEPIPVEGIKEKFVKIHIDCHIPFDSRIVYYTSKKEFRITQFWKETQFEKYKEVGSLLIFVPFSTDELYVFLFNTEEEIEEFFYTFSLSFVNSYGVYDKNREKNSEEIIFEDKVRELVGEYTNFPTNDAIAWISRDLYMNYYKKTKIDPDKDLLKWIEIESIVFKLIEKVVYHERIITPFNELESVLEFANSVLNRRQKWTERSLKSHVSYIFSRFGLPFDTFGQIDAQRRQSFLFPSSTDYKSHGLLDDNLTIVGTKTICKDKWKQVLPKADRVKNKYLITLQQGIPKDQLDEMTEENLTLIVPKPLHYKYPKKYQHNLWSIDEFIDFAKKKYTR